MKRESFFVHVYLSHNSVFQDNCDNWTNEKVLFGAQNYECLFHECFVSRNIFIGPIVTVVWENCLVKNKHARKKVHTSWLNTNGSVIMREKVSETLFTLLHLTVPSPKLINIQKLQTGYN